MIGRWRYERRAWSRKAASKEVRDEWGIHCYRSRSCRLRRCGPIEIHNAAHLLHSSWLDLLRYDNRGRRNLQERRLLGNRLNQSASQRIRVYPFGTIERRQVRRRVPDRVEVLAILELRVPRVFEHG